MKLIFVVLVANRDIKSMKIIEIGSLEKICHATFIVFFTPISSECITITTEQL